MTDEWRRIAPSSASPVVTLVGDHWVFALSCYFGPCEWRYMQFRRRGNFHFHSNAVTLSIIQRTFSVSCARAMWNVPETSLEYLRSGARVCSIMHPAPWDPLSHYNWKNQVPLLTRDYIMCNGLRSIRPSLAIASGRNSLRFLSRCHTP